ncbi:hypothetical protein AT238_03390 [Bartonella henselae]|nr:hypothetical protein [Bartonella henselae]OLL55642.1 hypothetical protein AT238_03390 [Bartonella henselae]
MFFLHIYCKKEKFPPFTIWLLLSSLGILLINDLEAYIHLIAPHVSNVITINAFDLENKYDQLNITTTTNKKFLTLHTDYVLPFRTFQSILVLNTSLIAAIVICTQLNNFQMQCFTNKRAPPFY